MVERTLKEVERLVPANAAGVTPSWWRLDVMFFVARFARTSGDSEEINGDEPAAAVRSRGRLRLSLSNPLSSRTEAFRDATMEMVWKPMHVPQSGRKSPPWLNATTAS